MSCGGPDTRDFAPRPPKRAPWRISRARGWLPTSALRGPDMRRRRSGCATAPKSSGSAGTCGSPRDIAYFSASSRTTDTAEASGSGSPRTPNPPCATARQTQTRSPGCQTCHCGPGVSAARDRRARDTAPQAT
ncbi:UNVERIFIED_CONTAM: hypothetical protein ACS92_06365 [Bacillus cereus]